MKEGRTEVWAYEEKGKRGTQKQGREENQKDLHFNLNPTGPSGTNIIIGSVAGAILLAAIVLGGTGWGFK